MDLSNCYTVCVYILPSFALAQNFPSEDLTLDVASGALLCLSDFLAGSSAVQVSRLSQFM